MYRARTLLLILYLIQTPFDGGGFEIYQQAISTLLIIAFWLLQLYEKRGVLNGAKTGIIPLNFLFLVPFHLFAYLSVINSVNEATSLWVNLYWINHTFFFLAVYTHLREREDYLSIIKKIIIPLAGIMAIWGFSQFYKGMGDESWSVFRARAMFEQWNSLGGYLTIVIIISSIFFLSENKRTTAFAAYLYTMILFSTLVVTFSRASWLTLLFCLMLYLTVRGIGFIREYKLRIFSLLLGMGIVFVLFSSNPETRVIERVATFMGDNNLPGGLHLRLDMWRSAWLLSLDNPWLGTGIGTFHLTFLAKTMIDWSVVIWMAHNDYVQFLSEIGFPGTIMFLIAMGIYVWVGLTYVIRIRKKSDLSENEILTIGIYIASLSPLIHSLVDLDLRTSGVYALFMFLSSHVLIESYKLNESSSFYRKFKFPLKIRRFIFPITAILAVAISLFVGKTVLAEYYFSRAAELEKMEKYEEAINFAQKALALKDGVSSYHEFLARNYHRYALFAEESDSRRKSALECEKEYKRAIELSPTVAIYNAGLASLYSNKPEYFGSNKERIKRLYAESIKLSPMDNYLRFRFGEILLNVGLYDLAIESLEGINKEGRVIINANTVLGEAYRLSGQLPKASGVIRNELKSLPDDGFANFIMGEILVDSALYDNSIFHFRKAIRDSKGKNKFEVFRRMGTSFYNSAEFDSALTYFQKVYESGNSSQPLFTMLHLTHDKLGNIDEAKMFKELAGEMTKNAE